MKLRKKIKLKKSTWILLIILQIFSVSFFFLNHFNKHLKPKMNYVIESQIEKYNKEIIMASFNSNLIKKSNLNNLIKINKNKNDEITTVDFDLEQAYQISLNMAQNIKKDLKNIDKSLAPKEILTSYNDDSFIIFLPLGIATNNEFLTNLGPKIPLRVTYAKNLVTALNTKIQNYGINNALIEIYLKVNLSENVYLPFTKKAINTKIEILLSSLIVEGLVPDLYNGLLEKDSSLINIPLNS